MIHPWEFIILLCIFDIYIIIISETKQNKTIIYDSFQGKKKTKTKASKRKNDLKILQAFKKETVYPQRHKQSHLGRKCV